MDKTSVIKVINSKIGQKMSTAFKRMNKNEKLIVIITNSEAKNDILSG